jgi:hypothetical protein
MNRFRRGIAGVTALALAGFLGSCSSLRAPSSQEGEAATEAPDEAQGAGTQEEALQVTVVEVDDAAAPASSAEASAGEKPEKQAAEAGPGGQAAAPSGSRVPWEPYYHPASQEKIEQIENGLKPLESVPTGEAEKEDAAGGDGTSR